MTRAAPREWRALRVLASELERARGGARGVNLGIGDDCAVLAPQDGPSVWTTDACLEQVHFRRAWASAADVAHKSLNAAVSDVAAMGARPLAALSHVTLSPGFDLAEVRAFARAQAAASRELGCPIVGGNLAHGRELQVVTSVLGALDRGSQPLLRSGARVGEEVWLVGQLGRARLGLELLEAGRRPTRGTARECVRALLRPRALVAEGPRLVGRASACIDVSDGLAGDAAHVAEQSGVALVLEAERLRALLTPSLEQLARSLGHDALTLLLSGGEDYALLATGPRELRPRFARRIGRVTRGEGVRLERDGLLVPVGPGFEHGARPSAGAPERAGALRRSGAGQRARTAASAARER